jgi:hypothetical protein
MVVCQSCRVNAGHRLQFSRLDRKQTADTIYPMKRIILLVGLVILSGCSTVQRDNKELLIDSPAGYGQRFASLV